MFATQIHQLQQLSLSFSYNFLHYQTMLALFVIAIVVIVAPPSHYYCFCPSPLSFHHYSISLSLPYTTFWGINLVCNLFVALLIILWYWLKLIRVIFAVILPNFGGILEFVFLPKLLVNNRLYCWSYTFLWVEGVFWNYQKI